GARLRAAATGCQSGRATRRGWPFSRSRPPPHDTGPATARRRRRRLGDLDPVRLGVGGQGDGGDVVEGVDFDDAAEGELPAPAPLPPLPADGEGERRLADVAPADLGAEAGV